MKETTIVEMAISTSDPVSLKRLRKDLYKIRKFEIQNLWQRSIFLVAFIVILITGYGHLIEKLMSEYDKWLTHSEFQILVIQTVCCILTFWGSIFSIIWIMMAKGSKAWYEIYERKICEIEEDLQVREEYRMNPGAPWTLDNSLCSCKAGAYSVSKINILLGQILLIFWRIAFYIHVVLTIWLSATYPYNTESAIPIGISATILTVLFFAQLFLPCLLKKMVESGSIKNPPL